MKIMLWCQKHPSKECFKMVPRLTLPRKTIKYCFSRGENQGEISRRKKKHLNVKCFKMVPRLTLPRKTIKYCFSRGENQGEISRRKKKTPQCEVFLNGAASRNRTKDTGIFSPLLYQLS